MEDNFENFNRPRSASVSSVHMYQERRKKLNPFGGSQLSISRLGLTLEETSKNTHSKSLSHCHALLLGLYQAYKERDAIFLACLTLSEKVERWGFDWNFEYDDGSQSFTHFLVQLATEERRQADFIFEWLYLHGGLDTLNYSGLIDNNSVEISEEDEIMNVPTSPDQDGYGLKGRDISVILFALQQILQRRASHIAGLLDLRSFGENSTADKTGNSDKTGNTCDVLAFLNSNVEKIFRDQETTNKRARQVMICLERHLKELNGF